VANVDYDRWQTKTADLLNAIRSRGYAAGTATTRIPIKNMHCSSCAIRIELAVQTTPGVISARVSLGTNAVDIEYHPEQVDFDGIRGAIESAGYRIAEPKISPTSEELDPAEVANAEEYRTLMRKFWFRGRNLGSGYGAELPRLDPRAAGVDADGQRLASDRLVISWRAQPPGTGLGGLSVL
jgi:Cu+-exporting ATPase